MCKIVAALLLTLLSMVNVSYQVDWCNVESCKTHNKGKHTLCAYPSGSPAKKCVTPRNMYGRLNQVDEDKIVVMHNMLRQRVAGKEEKRGSNGPQPNTPSYTMPNLSWNITLANIAQRWADQCEVGNDKCRDLPDYQVGQNVADEGVQVPRSIITIDLAQMVQDWYDEVQYFDKDEVKKFSGNLTAANGKYIGHYTQIVWAETKQIGCGSRNYREGNKNHRYLVCNYAPSGNIPGKAIYPTK